MRTTLVAAIALLAAPALAQAPDAMKKSDPGVGNSVQCWDRQTLVARDRNTGPDAQKNDRSAVAGAKPQATTGTAPSSSTQAPAPTAEQAANVKRPPGMPDC